MLVECTVCAPFVLNRHGHLFVDEGQFNYQVIPAHVRIIDRDVTRAPFNAPADGEPAQLERELLAFMLVLKQEHRSETNDVFRTAFFADHPHRLPRHIRGIDFVGRFTFPAFEVLHDRYFTLHFPHSRMVTQGFFWNDSEHLGHA